MFRPIRRKKNEISPEASKKLLVSERRGILALNGEDDYPYAIPINYLYCEEENRIYFHGARTGYKAELIKRNSKVCFTVFGNERFREEAWAPYVQSVVVFGRCTAIEKKEEAIEQIRKFARKYYPDENAIEVEIAASGNAVQMYVIEIEYMTGKEVQER